MALVSTLILHSFDYCAFGGQAITHGWTPPVTREQDLLVEFIMEAWRVINALAYWSSRRPIVNHV